MIDVAYPKLLELFPQHLDPKRSESASMLIWYLEHYYRLDSQEATDSVCDQPGDKGVDGIFVNDNDLTITIFQARISQKLNSSIGDVALKELVGTLSQFSSREKIEDLIASAGAAQVALLAHRLNLVEKIVTHELRGEFISNLNIDQNGIDFLRGVPNITFVGKDGLQSTYISDSREPPNYPQIAFNIDGYDAAEYIIDASTKSVVAPILARELIAMRGVSDQSLFA